MSYSFSVTGATKEEVTGKIRERFDEVVSAQPSHAADKEAAVVAAQNLVRLLVDPAADEEVQANVSGSLSWRNEASDEFISANLIVYTGLRKKETV